MKSKHCALTPITMLCAFLLAIISGGCVDSSVQKKLAIEEVRAPFETSAITLNVTAKPDLNKWNEMSNSCTIIIIQAESKAILDKVIQDPFQLKILFNGAGTDERILRVDRYAVMPGQQNTLHIDRAEGTRILAVVAGYYPFPSQKHMAYFSIPITSTSQGWISKKWQAKLTRLNADIKLSSNSLYTSEVIPLEQATK